MFISKKVRKVRLVLGALAITGVTVVSLVSPAPAAHAYIFGGPYGTVHGGVDFDGYCQASGWQGARLVGWSAGSWKCYRDVNVPVGIDLTIGKDGIASAGVHTQFTIQNTTYGWIDADAACQWTWQDSWEVADFVNWYDAYSIRCVQLASHD